MKLAVPTFQEIVLKFPILVTFSSTQVALSSHPKALINVSLKLFT
jgi:hypothetical protein